MNRVTRTFGRCPKTDCDQNVSGWCQWPCIERELAIKNGQEQNVWKAMCKKARNHN